MGPSNKITESLREFIASYERVWNSRDADALATLFSADADLVMGSRPRVQGRSAIASWWRTYFGRLDEGRTGTFSIVSARLLSPGVALANVDSTTAGRSHQGGRELPTRRARGTWIVVQVDGGWSVAALRGLPAEGEARTVPGSDR